MSNALKGKPVEPPIFQVGDSEFKSHSGYKVIQLKYYIVDDEDPVVAARNFLVQFMHMYDPYESRPFSIKVTDWKSGEEFR